MLEMFLIVILLRENFIMVFVIFFGFSWSVEEGIGFLELFILILLYWFLFVGCEFCC